MGLLKLPWVGLIAMAIFFTPALAHASSVPGANPDILFEYKDDKLTKTEKAQLESIVTFAERDVRAFFPKMTKQIIFTIETVDWDLNIVGGITGMATNHTPVGKINLMLSDYGKGGITRAIENGLRSTVLHELHHVASGWTIEDNKFGPGIHIATANEGLATVFSELLSGQAFDMLLDSDNVDEWIKEILTLPDDANYMHWVSGEHPDGRMFIGYKAGRHLIYRAMLNTNKNIIELSREPISSLYEYAGYR
ncbi:hypothetical protein DRW07_04485 [Alteromonas sediminis]|uniref:DUF2268 domain-containing protein n=1 Tax=Alteromonas sediminis TaxID=2259342 RepID=A0A3N5YAN4_9ALTE|nr:DUF2268 domain-containing putative Zn-dependent protease [Alteromonas sediminis]RPJ68659.1 hypothetical protein DRW07_04485 [Alteromonas sediminis]